MTKQRKSITSTFRPGHTTFNCESCGRLTRDTMGTNVKTCEDCYELAGIQNSVWDNGKDSEEFLAHYRPEAVSRLQSLAGKCDAVQLHAATGDLTDLFDALGPIYDIDGNAWNLFQDTRLTGSPSGWWARLDVEGTQVPPVAFPNAAVGWFATPEEAAEAKAKQPKRRASPGAKREAAPKPAATASGMPEGWRKSERKGIDYEKGTCSFAVAAYMGGFVLVDNKGTFVRGRRTEKSPNPPLRFWKDAGRAAKAAEAADK